MSTCMTRPARDLGEVLDRGASQVRCCVTCGNPDFESIGVYEPSARYAMLTGRSDNIVYGICSSCEGLGKLDGLGARLERATLARLGVPDESLRRNTARRRDVRRR